jgi:3-hydroxyacyl-CoA dehydrogenase
MIVSGNPVASEKLPALFDEIFAADADLLTSAVAFAEKIADVRPLPKVRDRKVDYPNHEAFLQFSRNTVKAMAGPFPAPLECVETVAASVTMKFEDGMKFERERFLHLIQTTESKALRHAFFAERVASKVPDVPADTPVRRSRARPSSAPAPWAAALP